MLARETAVKSCKKHGRNDRGLKCVCLNACSVANKRHLLKCVIGEDKIDIGFITESHLSNNHHMKYLDLILVYSSGIEGGGVLIAAKNSLPISRRIDLENECKLLWCEVTQPGAYLILLEYFIEIQILPLTIWNFCQTHYIQRKHKMPKLF